MQAQLTVVATAATMTGDDEPGEVNGDLVPAETIRRLARALGLLPDTAPATPDAPTANPDATNPDATNPDATNPALTDLLSAHTVAGTTLTHRPHIAMVDELTGQLLALTDAAGLRAGRPLGPPTATDAYSPTAALQRFVGLRDRRCRFPGCRKRPTHCDLHHRAAWPGGHTGHDNLYCLCRHHHRLVHQAPGWRLRGTADGDLEWTTPTGQVLITRSPRFGADDDLPPPHSTEPEPTEPVEPEPPPF